MRLGLLLSSTALRRSSGVAPPPTTVPDPGGSGPVTSLASPVIAGMIGSSRDRQTLAPTSTASLAWCFGGVATWIMALDPRILFLAWHETAAPYMNSGTQRADGTIYANDGNSFRSMTSRVPKVLAGPAKLLIPTQTSNSVQSQNPDGTTFSAGVYEGEGESTVFNPLADKDGAIVALQGLWPRASTNPNRPPQWAAGAAPRAEIPAIVSLGQNWADGKDNAVFADLNSVLAQSTSPFDPFPYVTRDGDAHFAGIGSYLAAKKIVDELHEADAITGTEKAIDSYKVGPELHPNPNLTGSVAISGVTNVSGTLPTGFSVSRDSKNGTTASLWALTTQLVSPGKYKIVATIDVSGMAEGEQEGISLTCSGLPTLTSGKNYVCHATSKPSAFGGWRNIGRNALGIGSKGVSGGTNINGGGTPQSGLAGAGALPLPDVDMGEVFFPSPFVTAETTAAVGWTWTVWVSKPASGSNTATIELHSPSISETVDPRLIGFPDDGVPVSITSPALYELPGDGETPVTIQLEGSEGGYYSVVSGTDAALWSVDTYGVARRSTPLNYGVPDDADANREDDVTFQLIAFNRHKSTPATKTVTVRATFVDQGHVDGFNRADVADITEGGSTGWERVLDGEWRVGIVGQRASATSNSGGPTGQRSLYKSLPRQGNTHRQRIVFRPRTSGSSATGSHNFHLARVDANNRIYARFASSGGPILVVATLNGVSTSKGFNGYQSMNTGNLTKITAQIIEKNGVDVVEVFQNGSRLKTVDGLDHFEVGSLANYSNILASRDTFVESPAATGNQWDDWQNIVAAPIQGIPAMYPITLTATTGSAGVDFETPLVGILASADDRAAVISTAPAGSTATVIADGATFRIIGPIAGTYSGTITEFDAESANGPSRVSNWSVTFS